MERKSTIFIISGDSIVNPGEKRTKKSNENLGRVSEFRRKDRYIFTVVF
jgi:hypothetical protein